MTFEKNVAHNIAFPVKYFINADDLIIYVTGDTVSQMEKAPQFSITGLQNWFQTEGLLFSSRKTKRKNYFQENFYNTASTVRWLIA